MTMNDTEHRAFAQLLEAHSAAVPCAPVRDLLPVQDIDAAYRVQRALVDQWTGNGRTIIGRKIGLTSQVVQKQLGVDQPDFGTLLDDMHLANGSIVPPGILLQPKVEAEIAVIFGRDLTGNEDRASLLSAIRSLSPALEIVDSRIADWNIGIVDTVADNASSGLFVLGPDFEDFSSFDFEGCKMEMTVNGAIASTGEGKACLGHPLNAAAWLAQQMHKNGTPVRAGDIVLTGALGPMVTVKPGDRVEAVIEGLGTVGVSFA